MQKSAEGGEKGEGAVVRTGKGATGEGQEGMQWGGGGGQEGSSGGRAWGPVRQRARSWERGSGRGEGACSAGGLGSSQSGRKEAAFVLGLVSKVNSLDEVHIQHPPLQESDSF